MENYLASAMAAQRDYNESVERCMHTLMWDTFKAHPNLRRLGVEVDYTPHPPYSCTYVIRNVVVDLGCGWIELPPAYTEGVGKVVHFIYTHAQAVVSVKGVGMLEWGVNSYPLP